MSIQDQMDDDLDLFFDLEALAVSATVGGATVSGIFDRPYKEDEMVAGYAPVLYCKTSAVTAVVEGTAVVIGGVNYEVAGIQPDGTGVTGLVLQDLTP